MIDLEHVIKIGEHPIAGTTHYAAPELFLGEVVTPACDIWSFGIMAFEASDFS
jgi:serine/threonine protein kinase